MSSRKAYLERARRIVREGDDFLLRRVVDDMMDRLSLVDRSFSDAVALFGRTPYLASRLRESGKAKSVVRIEESVSIGLPDRIATPDKLDLEIESCDLILAPLMLHWSHDLPGAFIQLARALRPDGLLMAVLPAPGTLSELRGALIGAESEISGGAASRIDAFTDIQSAGSLLQRAGLALPVVDQETVTVRYDTLLALVRDLRRFGVSGTTGLPPLGKAALPLASEIYARDYSDTDGRIRASFNVISLAAWKPHESQQKPLKPGSATARLADALSAKEHPLKR